MEIFYHLLEQFNFAIKNTPETMLRSRISTKRRIEYQSVGVILVFVEVELGRGSLEEYWNAIAQIIAESNGKEMTCSSIHAVCDWNNFKEGISISIFGILCYGVSFEFYKYDGSLDTPTLSKGRLSVGSQESLVAFPLAHLGMNSP